MLIVLFVYSFFLRKSKRMQFIFLQKYLIFRYPFLSLSSVLQIKKKKRPFFITLMFLVFVRYYVCARQLQIFNAVYLFLFFCFFQFFYEYNVIGLRFFLLFFFNIVFIRHLFISYFSLRVIL